MENVTCFCMYNTLLGRYPVDDIRRSYLLIVTGRMVFAWVVRSVGTTFRPEESEKTLRFAAFEPLKTHVVRFRCLGLHGAHG